MTKGNKEEKKKRENEVVNDTGEERRILEDEMNLIEKEVKRYRSPSTRQTHRWLLGCACRSLLNRETRPPFLWACSSRLLFYQTVSSTIPRFQKRQEEFQLIMSTCASEEERSEEDLRNAWPTKKRSQDYPSPAAVRTAHQLGKDSELSGPSVAHVAGAYH